MSFPGSSPGVASLGYMGTKVVAPVAERNETRDPVPSDINYDIGTLWTNRLLNRAFILTSKANGFAFWLPLAAGTANIFQLTPDVGGPVPSVAGNINLVGAPGVTTVGAGNTITIQAPGLALSTITTKFMANGVFTKNANTKYIRTMSWGAGGGGGSGCAQVLGTNSFGGHGGAAGAPMNVYSEASAFPPASNITIGVGGLGGAATAGVLGNVGGVGTSTIVQTNVGDIVAAGGAGGAGGTTNQGSFTLGGRGLDNWQPLVGGGSSPSVTDSAPSLFNIFAPGAPAGGGAGAGVSNLGTDGSGAIGGSILVGITTVLLGGSAGVAPGGSAGAGNMFTTEAYIGGGSGGGGGAGNAAGNGGNGGNGGGAGAAGGGGGSCLTPNTSGKGGDGFRGEVWLIEYF